jgi:hypothetical protein
MKINWIILVEYHHEAAPLEIAAESAHNSFNPKFTNT